MKKRAIVVVVDSMGCGALPDAMEYDDELSCNTLANLANATNGLNVPNLEAMGFGNIIDIKGVNKTNTPSADYGILKMKSKGKDTTTGHWELMGLVLENPFKTYKKFDDKLINEFIKRTSCSGILGNKPASGTAIIEELNEEHQKTKYPIIYTSADSVFQIALDIDLIPVETLYEWCKIAREILDEFNYGIS
ncbi:MAG: phosphopentomutase, partial [Cyanobacteria bacterium SIG27]|nr:phosphopentomutase [Cyanobacteria bacterium SIG27]